MDLNLCIAITALCTALVCHTVLRRESYFGLPLAYLLALVIIHLPGAVVMAISQSAAVQEFQKSVTGFRIATTGIAAYSVGVFLFGRRKRVAVASRETEQTVASRGFMMLGVCATLLFPFVVGVPTLGALVRQAGFSWVLSSAIMLKASIATKNYRSAAMWMALISCYPLYTLLFTGFLAGASFTLMLALCPALLLLRKTSRILLALLAYFFVFITAFVNYMANRDAIRDVVWSGASLSDRVETIITGFTELLAPSLDDYSQIFGVLERLNQNYFLGIAAERLDSGAISYLHGSTIIDAMLSLVPRALWSEKPIFAGSGSLVRDATGLMLSDISAWGVGNVMELYLNFGYAGVVLGFLLIAKLFCLLDRALEASLDSNDPPKFLMISIVCVALVFPEGSFVDIVGAAGAACTIGLFFMGLSSIHGNSRRALGGIPRR